MPARGVCPKALFSNWKVISLTVDPLLHIAHPIFFSYDPECPEPWMISVTWIKTTNGTKFKNWPLPISCEHASDSGHGSAGSPDPPPLQPSPEPTPPKKGLGGFFRRAKKGLNKKAIGGTSKKNQPVQLQPQMPKVRRVQPPHTSAHPIYLESGTIHIVRTLKIGHFCPPPP